MIIGVGTDIIEIKRFSALKESAVKKIFTPSEINYFAQKKLETMAGIFAAKEAIAKSFGTGVRNFSLTDIEILHDKKNAPLVKLHNAALNLSEQLKITNIKLSISHCKDFAIAFAIAEN